MRAIPVIVVALLATVAVLAQSPVRAGRWEITTQMEMPNMPVKMPEMKMTQCVTPEQAKDQTSALPRGQQPGRGGKDDCKVSDYKMSGNKATWTMTCTTPEKMTANGEMTFTDDSYTSTMKMTTAQGAMTMKLSGKRLGDCTQ